MFFSRFEYALKRDSRFLQAGTGNAEPNWDRFAADCNPMFTDRVAGSLAISVQYYQYNPPRKQLRANGEMSWSEPMSWDEREPVLIWLLRVVRAVRNNLFHGGKFPLVPISEPSRDRDLLAHAITILAACLELDASVRAIFNEGIDN